MNCKLILFITGLLISLSLSAQQAYTLEECERMAFRNNVRMKNAANDLRIAEHESRKARTNYFPSVSASGGGFLADDELLNMELSPGMDMSLVKNGFVGGVTAALPLFTGGQIVNGNKLSRMNVDKYRYLSHQAEYEVQLTVENYFWQVIVAQEKLRTLVALERQLSQLQHDVKAAVDAGVTARNDLLQVQLRNNEIQSTKLSVENAFRLSRRLLAQYIGAEEDTVGVTYVITDSLPENPVALYVCPEQAILATDAYNLLQLDVKAKHLEHRISVGKNLPTVAIGGGYMYENLFDKDHTFWMGFATVSVPLSSWWGGSHDIKKQKLRLRSAENNLTDQSELLKLRMESTWNDLTDAYRQVEIARISIEQATENLRLHADYYAAGTASMSNLLEAQTLYRQSRDKYMEAYAQYQIKKREYLQATGR